jgi:hypothetical protein
MEQGIHLAFKGFVMEGEQELILVPEVEIDDARAILDLGGDLPDGGIFIPFLYENFPGGIENQVFNLFSFPFLAFCDSHV